VVQSVQALCHVGALGCWRHVFMIFLYCWGKHTYVYVYITIGNVMRTNYTWRGNRGPWRLRRRKLTRVGKLWSLFNLFKFQVFVFTKSKWPPKTWNNYCFIMLRCIGSSSFIILPGRCHLINLFPTES
jgi:hypothetical protein